MKDYILGVGMVFLLTTLVIIVSPYPYIAIVMASLLFITFTIRSLYEEQKVALLIVQFIFTLAFCILGDHFLCFLLFSQWKLKNKREWCFVMPTVMYGIVALLSLKEAVYQMVFSMLLLLCITGVLCAIDFLLEEYITTKGQVHNAVKITAVSEMYEKKLNEELLVKHHLADRNARLEERENISRNIHNSVGHSITAAIMTLEAADMLMDTNPQEARKKINVANERIKEGLTSIRRAVRVLGTENEFCTLEDLILQLTEVVDNFAMDASVRIRTDFPQNVNKNQEETKILMEHSEFLTGALKECFTNGVKHGQADLFTVGLYTDSNHVRLYVEDNGKSDFNLENQKVKIDQGFGLKKIISYVRKWGGSAVFLNENGFRGEITLLMYLQKEQE